MRRASVTEAKNGSSGLLKEVRRGESVPITHRGEPVARLEPCSLDELGLSEAAKALVRRGIVTPPRKRLKVDELLARPLPELRKGASARAIVAAERRGSRSSLPPH